VQLDQTATLLRSAGLQSEYIIKPLDNDLVNFVHPFDELTDHNVNNMLSIAVGAEWWKVWRVDACFISFIKGFPIGNDPTR
jgi:hypothetical protein